MRLERRIERQRATNLFEPGPLCVGRGDEAGYQPTLDLGLRGSRHDREWPWQAIAYLLDTRAAVGIPVEVAREHDDLRSRIRMTEQQECLAPP